MRGTDLAATRGLWTSWSGILERHDADGWDCRDQVARVPVFVPARLPAGIEAVRLLGTNGVSNLAWVLIDGLRAEARDGEDANRDQVPTNLVMPPVAIDSTFVESKPRVFRVNLIQGQRLSLEVVAQRLGSPTDPILRVWNEKAEEVAFVDNTPGLGSDCALEFEAPATGEYAVVVHDAEHAGGASLRFRLRLGDFVAGVVPDPVALGVEGFPELSRVHARWDSSVSDRSGTAEVLIASALDGVLEADTTAPSALPGLLSKGGLALQGKPVLQGAPRTSLVPRVAIVPGWITSERERHQDGRTVTRLGNDTAATGRFDHRGDKDAYAFNVRTSGWWRLTVRSREFGMAADPMLRLRGPDGALLAHAVGNDGDPVLHHRFQQPGTYTLELTELARREGAGRGYLVHLEPETLPVRLSTETDRLAIPIGGKQSLKLTIESFGYDGPMRLEAENLPAGFELENPQVEARKKEWDLAIRCRAEVAPGRVQPVRFRARALGNEVQGTTLLDLRPAQRTAFPRMLSVPPGTLDAVWIAAVP